MESSQNGQSHWGLGAKIAFRFFFVFFILMIVPLPDFLLSWISGHILHTSYPTPSPGNGSGDTTYHYIKLLGNTGVSFIACLVWSIADRKRSNYQVIYLWYSIYIRYLLAFILLSYGMQKVIQAQFPPLTAGQLSDTYGQSTPMGLLWRFMQYSHAYNVFAGFAEITPAVLLLFRRTKMLGALIAMAVMANVVALNLCYDVPVKIYSIELLLMAGFIVAGDISRLIRFFILNKPADAVRVLPYFKSRKMQYAGMGIKYIFLGLVLFFIGSKYYQAEAMIAAFTAEGPLNGSYDVESFVIGHDTLPPLMTDSIRWCKFGINAKDRAQVKYMNESKKYYSVKKDTLAKTIAFILKDDSNVISTMHYVQDDSAHIVLSGKFDSDSVVVCMRKTDKKKSRLLSRGFHWINEFPMNY